MSYVRDFCPSTNPLTPPFQESRVMSHLHVGSAPEKLEDLRKVYFDVRTGKKDSGPFDACVFCAEEYQPNWGDPSDITLVYAGFDDTLTPTPAQLRIIDRAVNAVIRLHQEGHRVLVTCWMGRNRSALVAALAMLQLRPKMTAADAIARVHAARGPKALSNTAFVKMIYAAGLGRKGPPEKLREDFVKTEIVRRNPNPHNRLIALDPPHTPNRRWKCAYCKKEGLYDVLEDVECSYVYPPCKYCGETPTCAENCPGIAAALSGRPMPNGRRRNPDVPSDFDAAKEGYKRFHKFEPLEAGQLHGLHIPSKLWCMGEAKHVLYRSDKWEGKMHDYIHEHEGGVQLYRPDHEARAGGVSCHTPPFLENVTTLYKLGECLGFQYTDYEGNDVEGEGKRPLPELYSIPSGKALLVIEVSGSSAKLLAAIWGGGLDVRPEGIVG